MDNQPLICARCGKPIDPEVELWWQQPNGSIVDASYESARTEGWRDAPGSRFFHRRCLQSGS